MRLDSRSSVALRPIAALAFLVLLGGCERGCLRKKLDRVKEEKTTGVAAPIGGVDCPDGLARCVDGIVEASRLYSYDVPCSGSPEKCRCPWERVGQCSRGCAADDVVLAFPKDRAEAQMCALAPEVPLFAAPPPNDAINPSICEGERFRCAQGAVVACDPSAHRVAICTLGCAVDGATIEEDDVTPLAASNVLCLHPR